MVLCAYFLTTFNCPDRKEKNGIHDMSLLSIIQSETQLEFHQSNGDGVHAGPCPFCRDGNDRFVIYGAQEKHRFHCRVCSKTGDAIQFLREFSSMSYVDAAKRVDEIGDESFLSIRAVNASKQKGSAATQSNQDINLQKWQDSCAQMVFECQDRLHSDAGQRALSWLTETRKLNIETVWKFGIGYHPADTYIPRDEWGLPEKYQDNGKPLDLKIPKGIVIPNLINWDFVELRIRRPQAQQNYWVVAGSDSGAMFSTDRIVDTQPIVLCESEIDAMSIWSATNGEIVSALATGGTQQARQQRWVDLLSNAPMVLVAFDSDESGDSGADWWLDRLPNSKRLKPTKNDINDMLINDENIVDWLYKNMDI